MNSKPIIDEIDDEEEAPLPRLTPQQLAWLDEVDQPRRRTRCRPFQFGEG